MKQSGSKASLTVLVQNDKSSREAQRTRRMNQHIKVCLGRYQPHRELQKQVSLVNSYRLLSPRKELADSQVVLGTTLVPTRLSWETSNQSNQMRRLGRILCHRNSTFSSLRIIMEKNLAVYIVVQMRLFRPKMNPVYSRFHSLTILANLHRIVKTIRCMTRVIIASCSLKLRLHATM